MRLGREVGGAGDVGDQGRAGFEQSPDVLDAFADDFLVHVFFWFFAESRLTF